MLVQSDLQCHACGGQCSFSPTDAALRCDSCAELTPIHECPDADPAREFHYDPDLPHTEQSVWNRVLTHQCETCGGSVVFTGHVLSERCSYCDGPVVLKESDTSYEALGVIPFRKVKENAISAARTWVQKRIAAPNDLQKAVDAGRVVGLYAPFWTFDSKEAVSYYLKYKVKSGDNWVTRSTRGKVKIEFDDLLMPASHHVTPLIRDGILHEFRPDDLKSYDPAYLAGFGAEQHHQSVTEGLDANEKDKDLLIRNRIKKHANKSKVVSISYKTHTTGVHYRRILLPVWICHYKYQEAKFKIVTCGIEGRTFGERPFCRRKLYKMSGVASALIIAFGWFWGAMQYL